jgi:hypothetical protein
MKCNLYAYLYLVYCTSPQSIKEIYQYFDAVFYLETWISMFLKRLSLIHSMLKKICIFMYVKVGLEILFYNKTKKKYSVCLILYCKVFFI